MPQFPQPVVVHRGPFDNFDFGGFAAAQELAIAAYVDDSLGADRQSGLGGNRFPEGIPVISLATWRDRLRRTPSIVSALDPAVRREIVERITAAGGAFLPGRSDAPGVSPSVRFGEGVVTGNGPLIVASLSTVGRHVILMTPMSIGHDVVIGDFVTIQPSVVISGYVIIETDVVVGAGSVVVNGSAAKPLRIGRGARIAAGAVVTKSVREGVFVVGNPGRPDRPWLDTHNR